MKKELMNMCFASKLIIKAGTLIAIVLLCFAFFSLNYKIMMCTVSVYLFGESIVAGLIFDVIAKRIEQ
ncbi:MAG: hypothetical protein IKB60_05150 [Clostridia bacterium]|nr:hypothetical protein [Clostridia bacterium]